MADESEVEQALVDYLFDALYPGGEAGCAVSGSFSKVFRGWPLSGQLDQDLKDEVVAVTVFARNGVERVTTRYFRDWYELAPPVHTLTATVSGQAVTLGGTVSVPQNVAVLAGATVAFSYAVQAADTLATIAAALAAGLAAQGVAATASGAVLTVPGAPVLARVGGVGTVARELKRQDKSFQITIWAPSPEARDATARALDPALADLNFLDLPDRSKGLVRYERTISSDTHERMSLYRRDLFYWVEFPTLQIKTAPEVIAFGAGRSAIVQPSPDQGALPRP